MRHQRPGTFRPLRAALLAGAVAPLAYWAGIVASSIANRPRADSTQVWRDLPVVLAFGLPLAWAIALVWGLPMMSWLRRRGWLSPWALAAWGALGGWLVAAALVELQRGGLLPVRLSPLAGAVLGGVAGLVAWWNGWDRSGRDAREEDSESSTR